jgi:hypothetical protein
MTFAEAIHQVSKGNIVTCSCWKRTGEHLRMDSYKMLVYFNGTSYESVQVGYLALWMLQDQNDWELAQ